MKIYCYSNYDVLGDFYSPIFCDQIKPEDLKTAYWQMLFNYNDDTLNKLKNHDLYLIAEFDNITGEIISKKDFLLHIDEVINVVKIKRGLKEDNGNKQEN